MQLLYPDYQAQTQILGELRPALANGLVPKDMKFTELENVIADKTRDEKQTKTLL